MSKLSKHRNPDAKTYLLIGAPNVGKSTIFNLLTNSTAIVSNIDRMTTEHTMGRIKKSYNYLVDLPGTYNLSHPIAEEKETHYHLLHHKVDGMVNVISAFSIERDLYLTLQCIETGMLNTLCINMVDLINPKTFNWDLMSKKLNGLKVILSRSNRNKNTKPILDSLYNSDKADPKIVKYSDEIEQWIEKYSAILPDLNVSKRFASLMLLENNDYFISELKHHHPQCMNDVNALLAKTKNRNYLEKIRETKVAFIKKLLASCKYDTTKYLKVNISKQQKFDHYFLKKWIGIPAFILIALAIYYISFGNYAGGWLQSHFASFLKDVVGGQWLTKLFELMYAPAWLSSMFIEGILGGVFIVLAFIPVITILYICITIIQQVGLLSRVSILLDNALAKFGVSGRSVVNLLTAFGCNVPAIMLARSSGSKKERIVSTMITPFIPCTTKIIVISAITAAVFGKFGWIALFGFVVLSGALALLLGLTLSKTMFRKQKSFFCVEMVNWNGIDFRVMVKNVLQTLKGFLKKALLVITVANLIFWVFLHFGPANGTTWGFIPTDGDIQHSMISYVGRVLAYPLYPVFGDVGNVGWKLTTSLIAGIPAKELTLTTLNMMCNNDLKSLFTSVPLTLSFIVFMLYYMPCLPSINAIKTEAGRKNMFINIGVSLSTAYVLGTLVYWVGTGFSMIH